MCQGASPGDKAAEPAKEAAAMAEPRTTAKAAAVAEPAASPSTQQQQQHPASSSQLDGSQLPGGGQQQQGSKLSGGSGGSGKRPRSAGGKEEGIVVAGKEAVGRQVAVWSPKLGDWPKASIAQYNPATQQHLVRYLERAEGAVKHQEDWVCLNRIRFQWLSDPAPSAAPNPTYANAPRGEEALHHKVKVFWPGMCKWYIGKITSYDGKTKKHSVRYRDGDTQELMLRHEAVQYLEKEATPTRQRLDTRTRSDRRKDRAGRKAGGAKRQRGGSAGAGGEGDSSGEDEDAEGGDGGGEGGGDGGGEGPGGGDGDGDGERKSKSQKGCSTREEGGGATPAAAPPTASPPKDAVAGSHDVSAITGDSEDGMQDSEDGMGGSEEVPSSSGMESEDLGSEAFISEEEEDSDFEVESYRNRRRSNKAASGGAARSGSRRTGAGGGGGAARSAARKDRRSGAGGGGSGGAGGGVSRRSRDVSAISAGVRARPTARFARRDATRPAAAFRKVLRADEETIKAAGAGIVGARVAVFWHEDESYYKGKLVQFDGYHKRHKIVYDDGEEEWVSLPREAFRWLTPRARSAGCLPAFRHLMQQLGAEDCGLPGSAAGISTRQQQQTAVAAAGGGGSGGGGGGTPAAPGVEAATASAGAAAPAVAVAGPRGEACVGWQLSVLFDGDGQWYRGEVLGYDARKGRAFVLYDDGEDEWVALEREELTWHCQLAGHSGIYPGLPTGQAPAGRSAVGWRIGVYWPADQAFYCGEVVAFDAAAGRHDVAYDDGEEGVVHLGVDRVKWILPPGAAVDREKLETAEMRGRRRGGDESDPDYEVFEYRPRAQVRRPFQRMLSDGLSPAPTPLSGAAGLHAWDMAAGAEASLVDCGSAHPHRYLSLPFTRPGGPGGSGNPAPQHLGQPVVVRQLTRLAGLASLGGGGGAGGGGGGTLLLPQPITVRIYMSGSTPSTGSAASADTQLATPAAAAAPGATAAAAAGAGSGAPQPAAPAARLQGKPRLQSRLRALDQMSRRVAKAQQTIVKGVPTPLPSRKQVAEAARHARAAAGAGGGFQAGGGGMTSPTAAQRQQQLLLGSSHASGLHRLARGSAVNYSPFHHKRPHPADSEASSSSGSSDEEDEDEDGDMGADSAEGRRQAGMDADLSGAMSPRSMLNGAKIKPLADQDEGSALSDAMLMAPGMLGHRSPAMLSPLKLGLVGIHGGGHGGDGDTSSGLDSGLGGGGDGLLPHPPTLGGVTSGLGGGGGGAGGDHGLAAGTIPHSSSLAGGMDSLMLTLPLPTMGLPRGDSMGNLMGGLSRNASGMLGGSGLLVLGQGDHLSMVDDGSSGGGGGDLLGGLPAGSGMELDALQQEDAVHTHSG